MKSLKTNRLAVIGDKDVEANSLNIRTRASGELGAISVDEVKQKLGDAIATYSSF
ncbi:His/Gly/Thr/Pro-type tRNA ligase C-terminal domain-containing protein [Acaryochloris sp. IP29b_bin.137]|uniref:His/Gly/Thr/Pro-type tRNA ligase C-terminal domain-containing protein n=1 Tax=Acaryochloris sp. IP29b_bin.137 TaxID=2969217 RepID=UPI002615E20C|nr:His/Gly/Thr/Pro-type tRNA ligase C-terminal domain-containing protein [Acaryochloris sp. IP29b_bin.137]